jgi:hypothetical protein
MKRKYYYPNKVAEQPAWHFNYATQLTELGVGMGLVLPDVTASANDSRNVGYALGEWLNGVREFGPGATGQVETLKYGTGSVVFTLPEFLPPTPPAGMTAVLPGALARIFKFIKMIKAAPGYTEGQGLLMGIVGEELPPPPPGPGGDAPPPRLTVSAIPGDANEYGRVKYIKDGHEAVMLESRRGGAWEELTKGYKSPYIDNRPLLVPGQAEVREYRARFVDKGVFTSGWCDVAKITVGP